MLSVFGAPSTSSPPSSFERLDVLRDRGRDAVLREQFADRAVLAFGGGAVVAPDVEDERVVELALPLDFVDDPAGVVVGVLGEAGEDFHQPALERLLGLGDRIPRGQRGGARRELRVLRNPALAPWRAEDALAILVPAVVELAFVLVGPLLHDVVRAVRRARRPVHEERLVRREGLLLAQPLDGVLGDVLGEVVALAVQSRAGSPAWCCAPCVGSYCEASPARKP